MRTFVALFAVLVALAHIGCGDGSPASPSSTPSSTTSRSSHNAGRDCIGCHSFTVAGTVYKTDGITPNAGAAIRLTTAAAGGGTVVSSLTADASGNFYTSAAVSFGTGLYTGVANAAGSTRLMTGTITHGSCNRCHTSGSRIVVD